MRKRIILYLSVLSLVGFMAGCEKDGTLDYLLENPVPPTITEFPDLTFTLAKAADTIVFKGTPVDLGFQASVNYYLEACVPGNDFKQVVRIFNGPQDTLMTTTVDKLNKALKSKFPSGSALPMNVRIKGVATVDAGRLALGSSTNPLQTFSEVYTVNVSTY
ncbi:MAG: SusE domain-containing protein [Bacteroidales bacterium]|nr:SusE domain-containing protein [Bacteroidales bacterium]MCB9013685.1 SusE domain-containing protein [Bacteroidales bacterium]